MNDQTGDNENEEYGHTVGGDTMNRSEDDEREPTRNERGKWISAIAALLGLWMIVQAIWFGLGAAHFWNDVIVGAFLAAVGGYNYSRRADERLGNVAAAGVVALLGLWLIVSPFWVGPDAGFVDTGSLALWNDIVVGLITLGLGAYSAYEIHDRRQDVRRTAG